MDCQTYFFGLSHTVRVVSLVSDPYNLTSNEAGIMVKGPNATDTFPYVSMNNGANFWMDWEREAHIEIYEPDGTSLVSQECGIKLHGQYSRAMDQQAFKIYAAPSIPARAPSRRRCSPTGTTPNIVPFSCAPRARTACTRACAIPSSRTSQTIPASTIKRRSCAW